MTDLPDQTNTKPNQTLAVEQGKTGFGKIGCAIISGIITTYIMNQASLHGVDFTLLGMPSELVKSTLDGTIIGTLVGFTPSHFTASVTDGIIFIKTTLKQWRDAWNNPV